MLDERTLYLIQADMDGALDSAEAEELAGVLEASEEARALRAEFQRLGNLLSGQPDLQPPPDLAARMLSQIRLPEESGAVSWRSWFASIRPATAGLGFAAGLLATVAFYEVMAPAERAVDTARMVGTMVSGQQGREQAQIDSLAIHGKGLDGQVSLYRQNKYYVLSFELESKDVVEVEISYAKAGLAFGGLAHTLAGDPPESESYVISGGALRVENQGHQAFTVYLPQSASRDGGGRAIDIAIYSDGTQRFSGVVQG
mgnify:CR=1 FL=1